MSDPGRNNLNNDPQHHRKKHTAQLAVDQKLSLDASSLLAPPRVLEDGQD